MSKLRTLACVFSPPPHIGVGDSDFLGTEIVAFLLGRRSRLGEVVAAGLLEDLLFDFEDGELTRRGYVTELSIQGLQPFFATYYYLYVVGL